MLPTVSIIIPAYQTADLIPETLASVQAQTRGDFEALIIDDGSTDNLEGACAPFLADPRFALHRYRNEGVTAARNRGVALARGAFLAFVDSDDLMEPQYLSEMVGALEREPGAVVACCDALMFGVPEREGRRLSEFESMSGGPTLSSVLAGDFLVYTGATLRTEAVRAVGGYSTGMLAAEDFDLWIRLLIAGGSFVFIPQALARYRRRAGSLSNSPRKLHLGRAQAYLRALALLPPDRDEAAVCRRKLGETVGLMEFHQGRQTLLAGNPGRAGQHLREAMRHGVLPTSWRLLSLIIPVAPGLAVRAARRHQARLTPLARLASTPST